MSKLFKKIFLPVLLGTLIGSPVYAAFEGLSMMRMGAWDVDFSGNVNGFATAVDCDPDVEGAKVNHGLACGSDGVDRDTSSIRTGLLPSWFNFYAETLTDSGIKTAVHISYQPGIDSRPSLGGPLDGALGSNSANFRQVFLTWGSDEMGTFKIGRDLGVFGGDAILNDMTLLGVGTVSGLTRNGGRTSLGRIGVGYIYADWKAQIQYTSPNWNGFSFTAALVDPWGTSSLANDYAASSQPVNPETNAPEGDLVQDSGNTYSATATNGQEEDTYGYEAKVNYAFEGASMSGNVWASYIHQDIDFDDDLTAPGINIPANDSADADGFDIGAKLVFGSLDIVAYYYDGEGIGTTSFLIDAVDATGEERDSDGYYIQGRYRMPSGTLLGISYGESNLDETDYDELQRTSTGAVRDALGGLSDTGYSLVESNESWVFGVYHPVGEALNLVAEYTVTEAEAHNGNEAEENAFSVGAIMFF